MGAIALSSQSSTAPLSTSEAVLGSIGRRASTGTPSSFATSSILLSPNILYFFFAVGALKIAHIFDESDYRNIHHFCHIVCLFYYHGNKILRSCDNYNTVYGKTLEYRQRNVARAGGHIDEHIVNVAPENLLPELIYNARNDGAAPYYRSVLLFEQQIYAHYLYSRLALDREHSLVAAHGALVYTECLGD